MTCLGHTFNHVNMFSDMIERLIPGNEATVHYKMLPCEAVTPAHTPSQQDDTHNSIPHENCLGE